jgi:integrase
MSLRLFKRKGSGNWYIRGAVRGFSVYESTGTVEKSAAEAIRIRREKELLDQSVFGRKAAATFIEAAVSYMEAGGERRFVGPLIDHFGATPLSTIDQIAIDRAAAVIYPKATNATRVRQCYVPMSAILKHAAVRGLCDHRVIDRPSLPKGRVRWITLEEADRLITACSDHLRPLVIFLLYTGARLSEALYLDWRQVDLERNEAQFLETKNGQARGVPLHPRVRAALEALRHREGHVFRRPDGKPYARKKDGGGQIKNAFKGACRRAGIANYRPHDCRHTFATWFYMATRDLVALMELGGWNSERMVLRYTHINVSHRADTIAALPWTPDPDKPVVKVGSRGRAGS